MLPRLWRKHQEQNFEVVRCLFVNGFEGPITNLMNVTETGPLRSSSLPAIIGLDLNLMKRRNNMSVNRFGLTRS